MANVPIYNDGVDTNLYHSELNTSLQNSISDNGFVMPSQNTATISTLATTQPTGTVWTNTDTNQLIVTFNGVLYSLDMTPV